MKIRATLLPFLILLLTARGVPAATGDDKPTPPASPLTVAQLPEFQISKGAVLYERYCTFCHGETGRGDGLNAYLLPAKPADLGDRQLLAAKSAAELAQVILKGGQAAGLSPAMPAFAPTLTPAQAGFLVDHLQNAFKHSPANESPDSDL